MPANGRAMVRAFLKELLLRRGDTDEFADTDSLIIRGRLASVDVLELVVFLEEQYKIDFAEQGFDQNRVDSVDEIIVLIEESTSQTLPRQTETL
jgi:acyl carrier protein